MPAEVGTGATLTFASSVWTGNIISMNWTGIARESVPTSHLETVGGRTFIVGDLHDPGELEIEFQYEPDDRPPFDQAAEIITVTYPLAGGSTPANHNASGFMTNFDPGVLGVDELMIGSATIKFSGDVNFVAAT